ncbi:putative DNA helicase [Helianthus anomalus]
MNEEHPQFHLVKMEVAKSRNKQLVQLFGSGVGIHHAGMLHADRGLYNNFAWGVNLPAHTVVIKVLGSWLARHAAFEEDKIKPFLRWITNAIKNTFIRSVIVLPIKELLINICKVNSFIPKIVIFTCVKRIVDSISYEKHVLESQAADVSACEKLS